jgi:hypothetical protein
MRLLGADTRSQHLLDAIFVSRWSWDGRERREEADPVRRFPEPAVAGE